MEEARQYPALTRVNRVAVVGYFGVGLCALSILVCAFFRPDWIRPLGGLASICAIIQLSANTISGLSTGSVRWRKRTYDRYRQSGQFWALLSLNALLSAVYGLIALVLMDILK